MTWSARPPAAKSRLWAPCRLGWAGVVLLSGLALGACQFIADTPAPAATLSPAAPSYLQDPLVEVVRGPIEEAVRMQGRVGSERVEQLSFDLPGRIATVRVGRGETVAAGDLLATLDPASVESEIAQARETLAATEQQMRTQEAQLSEQRDAAQYDLLLAQSELGTRRQALNDLLDGPGDAYLAAARAAVDLAQTAYAQRQAELDLLRATLPARIAAARAGVALQAAQFSGAQERVAAAGDAAAELAAAQADQADAELSLARARHDLELLESPDGPFELRQARSDVKVAAAELGLARVMLQELEAGPDELLLTAGRTALEAAILNRDIADRRLADIEAGTSAAGPELAQLRADEDGLRSRLDELVAQLDRLEIRAPFGGVITAVRRAAGAEVRAFEGALELSDPSALIVTADVAILDKPNLLVGQVAEVRVDSLPGLAFAGRITALPGAGTGGQGSAGSGSAVRLTVDWRQASIEVGLRVRVKVTLEQREDVLKVPLSAVRTINNRSFVETLIDGRRRSVLVTTGIRSDTEIEILSGLRAGARVFESI